MQSLNKQNTCAFTGHRPQKLNYSPIEIKRFLCSSIQTALNKGYTNFITGMAPGVDTWAGELLLEFKNIYPQINIICALPYPAFCKSRMDECGKILNAAYYIHTSCSSYTQYSYQMRNMWMVDNCTLLIAVFTGDSGGTQNTINYAKKQGVEIYNPIKDEL